MMRTVADDGELMLEFIQFRLVKKIKAGKLTIGQVEKALKRRTPGCVEQPRVRRTKRA